MNITESLPSALQQRPACDQRAERVAVGALVRDEHEALVLAELVEHLLARAATRLAAVASPTRLALVEHLARCASRGRPCRRRRTRASACASCAARRRPGAAGSRARSAGPRASLALLGVAEHAHEDARMAQIGAGLDIGHGDESDPGSLRSRCMASLRTSLMASSTRRIRSPVILDLQVLEDGQSLDRRPAGSAVERTLTRRRAPTQLGEPPVIATASVERCHGPGGRPRPPRRQAVLQLRLRRGSSLRLAFRSRRPGSADGRAAARRTRSSAASHRLRELALDLARLVDLQDVALLDVLVVRAARCRTRSPAATSRTSSLKRRSDADRRRRGRRCRRG